MEGAGEKEAGVEEEAFVGAVVQGMSGEPDSPPTVSAPIAASLYLISPAFLAFKQTALNVGHP